MPMQIPLKTGAETADNNTRVTASPVKQSVMVGKQSSSLNAPAEKQAGKEMAAAPASVILQMPAAPAAIEKPSSPAPLSHAERVQIVKQVADSLGKMPLPTRSQTPEQITIQLHPKDWGKLHISVTITPQEKTETVPGQKVITAHIVAESRQVKAALESRTSELHTALRSAGMELDKMTVTVQSRTQSDPTPAAIPDGQPPANSWAGSSQNGQGGQPGGSSFAAFAGNPQGGRQGQPSPYPNRSTGPEPDDLFDPLRRVS